MKRSKKSIADKILIYLIIFSAVLLIFLYIFQISFLNIYYESYRTKQLKVIMNDLNKNYNNDNYKQYFEDISLNNDVCIELVVGNNIEYSSSIRNRKCMFRNNRAILQFEENFIITNGEVAKTEITNPNFNNKTLISGKKIADNTYLFVNTSIEPIDDSIKLLKSQFIYIAIIILAMAVIVSYFLSKNLSSQIIKLSKNAKNIGKKGVVFDNNTKILEIDELATTLNNTSLELSKTDELRRELLANVSHDLKTPLTLIKAYAEAAKDLDSNKKINREKDLDIIIEETNRLTLLVNDILELSKLESNINDINITEFNLYDLVTSIISKFDILTKEGYKFIINSNNNVIVKSDYKKLEQAIYNLVNNAINYIGEDKVVIINIIDNNNTVRVEVIDHGIGIKESDLDLIWNKYYKVDKKHKRNKYGTGVGLSIVKSTMINLGYNYGVLSKEGSGTTFYFEIKK